MASAGLKRVILQKFMASFEEFLCACRDEVLGRPCSIPSSEQKCIFTTIHPPLTPPRRVTLGVCPRQEIRMIRMQRLTSPLPAYAYDKDLGM